jgi:hypothetical protein
MKAVNEHDQSPQYEVDDTDDDAEDLDTQTVVLSDEDFEDDSDISMEVNVDKLVAEFEKADSDDVHRRAEIRRRLEELTDTGDLEDTYAMEFDD